MLQLLYSVIFNHYLERDWVPKISTLVVTSVCWFTIYKTIFEIIIITVCGCFDIGVLFNIIEWLIIFILNWIYVNKFFSLEENHHTLKEKVIVLLIVIVSFVGILVPAQIYRSVCLGLTFNGTRTEIKRSEKCELIDFSSEFVMEDDSKAGAYYTSHKEFIEPYCSYSVNNETLIVTTLKDVTSCGTFEGEILISNDTIDLLIKELEICKTFEFHKCTYHIVIDTSVNYVIKY